MNTATANLVVEDTDFTTERLGPPVAMTRTWNADPSMGGMFGNGWTFSYEATLSHDCNGAVVRTGAGQSLIYTTGAYCVSPPPTHPLKLTPPAGSVDSLFDLGGGVFRWDEKRTNLSYRFETATVGGVERTRLVSVSDPHGNAVTVTHNPDGTLASVTDAAGAATTFAYDGAGRCTAMAVPGGGLASYGYDAAGNLTLSTDLAGAETSFEYDAGNGLVAMTTGGRTTRFEYAALSGNPRASRRLAAVVDARGGRTALAVDSCGNVASTGPRGGVSGFSNDGYATIGATDPLGNTAALYYSSAGLLTKSCDPQHACIDLTWDDARNVTSFKLPTGHTTTLGYDASGNLTSWTSPIPVARTWTKSWNATHDLVGTTTPLGFTTAMTYDARGLLATFTDPRGGITSVTRDAFGNPTTVTDALGRTTTLAYDALGRELTARTDARGHTTQYATDENGRTTRVTHPDGRFTSYRYDCCAMTGSTDENGHTSSIVRDGNLKPTRAVDAAGNATTLEYDEGGNLVAVTDPLGNVTRASYDAADRPVSTTDPTGATTTMAFDAAGHLVGITDPDGNATAFQYANGGVSRVTDPLGHFVGYVRRGDGKLWWIWNGRAQQVMFTYDADGRTTGKSQVGVTGWGATYAYDAADNLTQVVDATGTLAFEYDALGRVTRITYPDGLVLQQTYDAVGNLATTTYPGGLVATFTYDARDRLTRVAWGSRQIDTTYDGERHVLTETRSNGTTTTWSRDPMDRVVAFSHARGATPFAQATALRDARGKVTQEASVLPVSPAVADGALTGSVDAANQLVTWGSGGWSWDADGNLAAVAGPAPITATHDAENHLTSITRGGVTTTFRVNGIGQTVGIEEGGATRVLHYDDRGRLMFESDAGGTVTAIYLYRGRRPVALRRGTADYFYHHDRLGSVVALTDATGAIANAYAYLPFGEVAGRLGTVPNPFTFAGGLGVLDLGQGLYRMGVRHYDAATGRFLERDPIGPAGGLNLYAYAGNDPIDATDATGMEGSADEAVAALVADAQKYGNAIQATKDAAAWTAEAAGVVADNWFEIGAFCFDKAMNFTPYGAYWTGAKIAWLTVVEARVWQNGLAAVTEGFKALSTEAFSPLAGTLVDLAFEYAYGSTGVLEIPPECQVDWTARRQVAERAIDAAVKANARGATHMRWR